MKQRAQPAPQPGRRFRRAGAGTDFAALARAFGGHGVEVTDRGTLARRGDGALARDRFTLIAAHIPRRAYDGAF